MNTYQERVGRYRILAHVDLPEAHKAEMRRVGMNPDDQWGLIYSTDDQQDADEMLAEIQEPGRKHTTYKLVDAGEATVIERPVY